MSNKRRTFSPEQKAAIVLEHLSMGAAVSELCDRHSIQPNMFYRWQSEFMANASRAFVTDSVKNEKASARQLQDLEDTVCKKDSVIAELVEENIKLKKQHGLI